MKTFPLSASPDKLLFWQKRERGGYGTTYGQGIALLPSPALCGMNWCFIRCWSCPLASLQGMTPAGGGSSWSNNRVLAKGKKQAETAANNSTTPLTKSSHTDIWSVEAHTFSATQVRLTLRTIRNNPAWSGLLRKPAWACNTHCLSRHYEFHSFGLRDIPWRSIPQISSALGWTDQYRHGWRIEVCAIYLGFEVWQLDNASRIYVRATRPQVLL